MTNRDTPRCVVLAKRVMGAEFRVLKLVVSVSRSEAEGVEEDLVRDRGNRISRVVFVTLPQKRIQGWVPSSEQIHPSAKLATSRAGGRLSQARFGTSRSVRLCHSSD